MIIIVTVIIIIIIIGIIIIIIRCLCNFENMNVLFTEII